jgi:hypothetical protein
MAGKGEQIQLNEILPILVPHLLLIVWTGATYYNFCS